MQRIVKLLIISFLVSSFSWAQDTAEKNWRLSSEGKLQHFVRDSGVWENTDCGVNVRMTAFHFVAENDGWAVGQNATLLHWDGEKWSEVLVFSSDNLLSVYFQDAKNGWVSGTNGTIIYWNGTGWNSEASPVSEALVNVKPSATGTVQITASNGAILERVGGQWQVHSTPVAPVLTASINSPE